MDAMTGALAGSGAITIWQDARAEARADFFAWHNGEHLAERVGIPKPVDAGPCATVSTGVAPTII